MLSRFRLLSTSKKQVYISKYIFAILVVGLVFVTKTEPNQLLVSLVELVFIWLLTNIIALVSTKASYIFNSICILLFLLEQFFLYFAGTYLSMVMISNIDSLQAISAKLPLYTMALCPILIVSFLPVDTNSKKVDVQIVLLLCLTVVELGLFKTEVVATSPFYNFNLLLEEKIEAERIKRRLEKKGTENLSLFFKTEVRDYRTRPAEIGIQPNIVLIFAEGLSQNIINDERLLMPFTRELQSRSLTFSNYYNHTFATYRGLIGQLYSGYQFENYEKNSLVSIQSILSDHGYGTYFLNTEPHNQTFTTYLEEMKFDEVTTLPNSRHEISDKRAFELLYETLSTKGMGAQPIFVSMYTFGTHIALDSEDAVFAENPIPIFNRFYNFDVQFQKFMIKIESSPIFDNTIFIVTTDHATYVDEEYMDKFPLRAYGSLDEVPFFIYYKGVNKEQVNANGRNSLTLAPTILDFLDISGENYFLGSSLFSTEPPEELETIYSSELNYLTTENDSINFLSSDREDEVSDLIEKYYSAKLYGIR